MKQYRGGTHTCYYFVALNLDFRKTAWQAFRLVAKSDGYPPLKSSEVRVA
jgi:hypothetical protein